MKWEEIEEENRKQKIEYLMGFFDSLYSIFYFLFSDALFIPPSNIDINSPANIRQILGINGEELRSVGL